MRMHAVLEPALVRTVLLLALTALLAEAADGGGAAHTAAFVCNVPVNDSVAVDVKPIPISNYSCAYARRAHCHKGAV